tara:strand:+ start:678 stop:1019 length:342 start_codon:yes stop_codon:yes gene_type:complete
LTNSRTKGAAGEREVINILKQHLPGTTIERNLMQTAKGGYDFLLFNKYACEVKRYAKGKNYLTAWWDQAARQASDVGMQPVLFYRFDRKPWRVVTQSREFDSIEQFLAVGCDA